MPAIGIRSTVYPFDYNKNNPMEGFDSWNRYIRIENMKASGINKKLRRAMLKKMLSGFKPDFKGLLKETTQILNK